MGQDGTRFIKTNKNGNCVVISSVHREKIEISDLKSKFKLFEGFEPIDSEEYTFEYIQGGSLFFIHGIFRDSKTLIKRSMCEYIDIERIGMLMDRITLDVKWKKINK